MTSTGTPATSTSPSWDLLFELVVLVHLVASYLRSPALLPNQQ